MAQQKPTKTQSDEIDANLKRVYDEIVNEEVPDRFRDLLSQLKQQMPSNDPDEPSA